MASSFIPPLVQRLKAALDESAVLEAFAPLAGRLFGNGCRLEGLDEWRLFPARRGGFTVSYRFHRSGGGSGHGFDSIPFDVSSLIRLDEPSSEGEFGPDSGSGLARSAFQLPSDPKLNQLGDVLAGQGVPEWFHRPEHPAELVSYRPLSRATIRFAGENGEGLYLRAAASRGRFERGARLAGLASERFLRPGGGRGLFPRLVDTIPELRATLLEECPGTLMHHCLDQLDRPGIEAVADALVCLFRGDCRDLTTHNALDEAEATAWMLRRAAVARADSLPGIDADLLRLFEAGVLIESPPPVPLHRDLHDKQILLGGRGGVILLDPDTLAAGDPALDLANLTVHLELRALQGKLGQSAALELSHQLLSACAGQGCRPSTQRMTYYRACVWLRLAGVYSLRSSGIGLIPTLLRRGRKALDSLHNRQEGKEY